MEDLKPEQNAEDQNIEEEDEDKLVKKESAKMGKEETDIMGKIQEICKPHMDNEELDSEDPEVLQTIHKDLAKQIQEMMLRDYGRAWSVAVGKRLNFAAGLRRDDQFANFKIGIFVVMVFQINQQVAA